MPQRRPTLEQPQGASGRVDLVKELAAPHKAADRAVLWALVGRRSTGGMENEVPRPDPGPRAREVPGLLAASFAPRRRRGVPGPKRRSSSQPPPAMVPRCRFEYLRRAGPTQIGQGRLPAPRSEGLTRVAPPHLLGRARTPVPGPLPFAQRAHRIATARQRAMVASPRSSHPLWITSGFWIGVSR